MTTVAATFLDVPAHNVAVVQRGSNIFVLEGGQHVITDQDTTFRAFYTLSERQYIFKSKPTYTVEGIPVIIELNLRYLVFDPILLAEHYNDPIVALRNKAQIMVNEVVSSLGFHQLMRAQTGAKEESSDECIYWELFRGDCADALCKSSNPIGINVLSFEVMNINLEGQLADYLKV